MSVFECYFNHTVGLHRYSSLNDCGDIAYEPPLDSVPVSVPCRIEYNYKEIIDKDGNKITSEARIFTNVQLNPLDVVVADGRRYTVKACRRMDSLTGAFDHYEVYL